MPSFKSSDHPTRRRLLWILLTLLAGAVAAAAVLLPYRPVVVAGTVPLPGPYALPPGLVGMKLHVFNTGMNRMSGLLVGKQRPWRPAPAFVVEHPTQGLIVFDCGLSEEVARDGESALPIPLRWLMESRGRPDRALDAQMLGAGMDPSAVSLVVISHLHEDHTGVVTSFDHAKFVGGAGTRDHFRNLAPRWREITSGDPAQPLPPFDGAVDLFGDGSIEVIPGGGHTPEDLMLLVSLPGGPVLLAGDAIVHRDWLADDDVQRIPSDPERAATVRNQVRALLAADSRVVLLPGHDLGDVPTDRPDLLLHHPEWFHEEEWPVGP